MNFLHLPDVLDLELQKALLDVSILPVLVTPIVDPVVGLPDAPCSYPAPPLPVLQNIDQDPIPRMSPLREVADSPIMDVFPSYIESPPGSKYEPVTSRITPSLREDDGFRPPSSLATMDQYLPRDGDLLLGESTDLPLLATPLTPRPFIEEMVLGSSLGSPAGEPVAAPSHGMPDLSREGPFDVPQDASESGATPRVLDSLPGCQYRMTSYDEDVDRSDLSPAYGIHLHDPRLLEYVGAPESARLLRRSLEYLLHHMGRVRTLSAALQLQHDAGLILSNLQVLGQFVTSLNQMSSEVMHVAFAHEPFPTEAVQFVAPSQSMTGGALHGGHGCVVSTIYSGDTWTFAVVVMQHVRDMFGLFPRPSEVEKTESSCSVTPFGGRTGGWLTLCDIWCIRGSPPFIMVLLNDFLLL